MKRIPFHYHKFSFAYPAPETPTWKNEVDRWYQLDAPSYGLAQAYTVWKPLLPSRPSFIFLASPGASNETDWQFAQSGAMSPAKFVHTLPNIRSSALCQLMNWSGPVLCLQKDPGTQIAALEETVEMLSAERPVIWVLGVQAENERHSVHGFFFDLNWAEGSFEMIPSQQKNPGLKNDRLLFNWLSRADGNFTLNQEWEIQQRIQP